MSLNKDPNPKRTSSTSLNILSETEEDASPLYSTLHDTRTHTESEDEDVAQEEIMSLPPPKPKPVAMNVVTKDPLTPQKLEQKNTVPSVVFKYV